MNNRTLLVIVLIIIIIILWWTCPTRAPPASVVPAPPTLIPATGGYPLIPGVAPTQVPIYADINLPRHGDVTVADYTSVPSGLGSILKQDEDPTCLIIDRKIPYYSTDPKDQVFDVALAIKMAEHDIIDKLKEMVSNLIFIDIERLFSATQTKLDNIMKDINESAVNSEDVKTRLDHEDKLIRDMSEQIAANTKIAMDAAKSAAAAVDGVIVGPPCADKEDGCKMWARDNDCLINPIFMFEHCPRSCNVCGLGSIQRSVLQKMYNSRGVPNCAFHGGYGEDPDAIFGLRVDT